MSKEDFREERKEYDNIVFKGIKKVDRALDTLLKDIDCEHTRYLLANRILSASISSNVHYYTNIGVKEALDKKLDIIEKLFSDEDVNEQD